MLDSSEVTAGEAKLELSASAEVGHLPLTNCIRGAQVLEDAACAWGAVQGPPHLPASQLLNELAVLAGAAEPPGH